MIIVKIIGGLGNQIAQYVFGRCCAERLGVPLKLDITGYRDYTLHDYGLDRFSLRAEVATEAEIAAAQRCGIIRENTLLFDPAIPSLVRDGVYLDGYWGDYRYSQEGIARLRREFQPRAPLHASNAALLGEIRGSESVSLHIRRGDYVTNSNCVLMPLSYYEDALREVIHRIPDAHVFIFSDDLDWVEKNLDVACPHTFVHGNDALRNVDDFQLMRSCRHHIVANSTFSGWAAMLDEKEGLVVAPQQYFRPDDPWLLQTFGRVDQPVWPPRWMSMPIRRAPMPENPYLNIAGGYSAGRPIRVGVWNYYEELTTDGFIFKNSNASIGHNLLKPWCDLHAYGQAHGIQFVTLDQVAGPEDLDAVIFQDRPRMDSPMVERLLSADIAKYLCLYETEIIKPDNWDAAFHRRCDRVFTWSDDHVDQRRYIKLNFAIDPESPYDFAVLKSAFHQRKLYTLIAGAKGAQHPNELYSERIRAIDWLQTHAAEDFDLYGVGWNRERFPSYRGSVQDKLATLSRYRFAICYENARNYPGYITEKILDCFRAGVVPIYLGAPNITQWIPRDCFIDRNDFASERQLHAHLSVMDAETHGAYLDRIRDFLAATQVYPFSIECFITTLTSFIARDVKARRSESPDVTVAIPTYNYGKYLHLAVGSALAQNVANLEVLVFDNASTDATAEVLSGFAGDPRLRVMRNTRNIGGQFNWRNAHRTAAGRYLTMLSADDFFLPGHLSRMLQVMQARPTVSLAYCPCVWVNEADRPLQVMNHPGHAAGDYVGGRNEVADLLSFDCYITPSAALIRRSAFDLVGELDVSMHGAHDWDLWIRIAEKAPDFAFFKEPLVCYRVHPEQDTVTQTSHAYTLIDHIDILWNALERGSLPLFKTKADDVLALLKNRFNAYPIELVAYLEPHIKALEENLSGTLGVVDIRAAREEAKQGGLEGGHRPVGGGGLSTVEVPEDAAKETTVDITVAVMSYNNAAYIGQTINSILAQQGVTFEVIVFDDGSKDASVAILQDYKQDPRFHFEVNATHLGKAGNFNKCLMAGSGRYVTVLSSDDLLYQGHLASLLDAMEQNPQAALGHAQCMWIDEFGLLLDYPVHPGRRAESDAGSRDELIDLLSYGNYITSSAAMLRRSIIPKISLVHGTIYRADMQDGDWELWIRLARMAPDFVFLQQPSVGRRMRGGHLQVNADGCEIALADHTNILEINLVEAAARPRMVDAAQPIWTFYSSRFDACPIGVQKQFQARAEAIRAQLKKEKSDRILVVDAPLVSVIVPTMNRPRFLRDALNSICLQTYKNWEVIVVNDGGQDVSDVIHSMHCARKIKLLNHDSNWGLPAGRARNTALRFAKGEIVCYLDDDDLFKPDHLQTVVSVMQRQGADFVYTDSVFVVESLENGQRIEKSRRECRPEHSKGTLLIHNYIPINCWAHKRSCLEAVGLFDEKIASFEDWDLLIRIAIIFDLVRIPIITVEVRQREQADNMLRRTRYKEIYEEIYRRYPIQDQLVASMRNNVLKNVEINAEGKREPEPIDSESFYELWKLSHSYLKRDALWIAERMESLVVKPCFHLVIIVPEGREACLANNIKSLGHQFYSNWRLSIVAAGPVHVALNDVESIAWIEAAPEQHLAAANRALLDTPADWVGMWEAGDKLAPHALFVYVDKAERHPEIGIFYSDEDQVNAEDVYSTPFFKTDFNLEMLRAAPFVVGGLLLCQRDQFAKLGGFDPNVDGVESFDLVLRAFENMGRRGIGHIADVLYHRYTDGGHSRRSGEEVEAAHRRVLEQHLTRVGIASASLEPGLLPSTIHLRYQVIGNPLVSILITTKNQVDLLKRCLTSLIEGTGYSNCEILVLDIGSDEPEAVIYLNELKGLNSPRLRVIDYAGPFNLSAINNLGAREATGEYLVLLHNDTAVLHEEWLEEMLGIAQQADVGAVGAKLFSPDGKIQHAGVILGIGDSPAEYPFSGQEAEMDGYFGRAKLAQECSAVSAACLLVKRALYLEVGGLDEERFQLSLNDVDFCQRLGHQGYRNVFTPHARLLHEFSESMGGEVEDCAKQVKQARLAKEKGYFLDAWRHDVAFDPAYNRNMSTHGRDFLIEISPALAWDPEWRPRPRVLAHPADRFGCGEYRVIAPMRALNDAGRIMGWDTANYLTSQELFRMEPDIILLQRQVDPHQLELIEGYIRHSKAFRIYEIDDLITNIPIRSIRKKHFNEQKGLHKRFRKGIAMCDRFVVSTDYLAEQYKGYSDDIVVVQNYVERARWGELKPARRHREKARVGWAGSVTHDGDLAEIFDVVKATAQEVDWVFLGMCPDEIRPYVAEFHAGVGLEDYPAKLSSLDLDLAVAPLEDVPFNHGKSHLRLLEYGVLGYPVICTDITPYRGDYPVTRVANRFKDWVDAIRAHVADRDELVRRGDALRDYINANWILEDNLDIWAKAWLP